MIDKLNPTHAEIRDDTTNEVIEFMRYNKYLTTTAKMVVRTRGTGVRQQAKLMEEHCADYADRHNGNFGELFVAELPLAYWIKVVKFFKEQG